MRPLCAGEALRRLVGKVLLRSELPALRQHLLPHQLAVGVPAGAEVMPHLFRQLQQHHRADADRVCLSFDEGNVHYVVDRHVFLTRMQEVAPGLSRWLEYIYPTDILSPCSDSFSCGWATGLPIDDGLSCCCAAAAAGKLGLGGPPGWRHMAPRLRSLSCSRLPSSTWRRAIQMTAFWPGLLAGPSNEVMRALPPRLGLRLSAASVALVAGRHHQVDFRPFAALGRSMSVMAISTNVSVFVCSELPGRPISCS